MEHFWLVGVTPRVIQRRQGDCLDGQWYWVVHPPVSRDTLVPKYYLQGVSIRQGVTIEKYVTIYKGITV